MTLEDQVTSLELSKRLKELGVKQESLYYWSNATIGTMYEDEACTYIESHENPVLTEFVPNEPHWKEWDEMEVEDIQSCSAFTVAELGELISCTFHSVKFGKDKYRVSVIEHAHYEEPKEADARAKLLIYLLENNLVPHPKKEEVG